MKVAKDISTNKKNSGLLKFLVGAFALLFFIAILNFFNSPIKNTFYVLSSPVQKTFWSAGESCGGFLNSFVSAGSLNNENQNLKNKIQKLQAQVVSLQSVVGGNQAQSAVSSACQDNGFKLLMAGVVGLDDKDVLSINKGLADGVLEGMPVINQQGAVFGRVFKVYKNFSQVMLISNKNSVISVKVQQQDIQPVQSTQPTDTNTPSVKSPPDIPAQAGQAGEIDGVIKGNGSLGVYLDLVPIDSTINQGDILVTSALDGIFPKDLLVGTIAQVQKNDQNPHQQAQVQPFLSSSIDNLFVILNYKR